MFSTESLSGFRSDVPKGGTARHLGFPVASYRRPTVAIGVLTGFYSMAIVTRGIVKSDNTVVRNMHCEVVTRSPP